MVREVTLYSLNKWYKRVFEKLGWIVLAAKDGKQNKLKNYKAQIQHLKEALTQKLTVLEENDRKRDIEILLTDVKHLEAFLNEHFKSDLVGGRFPKF